MLNLTDIEREDLRRLQKRERGSDLYIRITVLLMLDGGFSVSDIALEVSEKKINYVFYETFNEFKQNVLAFFKDIKPYKQELETLLTLNFHLA